jgi:hypothetical protein
VDSVGQAQPEDPANADGQPALSGLHQTPAFHPIRRLLLFNPKNKIIQGNKYLTKTMEISSDELAKNNSKNIFEFKKHSQIQISGIRDMI